MKLLILLAILVEVFPIFALKTIVDVLQGDSRFKTLVGHVKRTGLDTRLDELSKGTLFAPTNDAFDGKKDTISRDELLYHLTGAEWHAKELFNGQILESMYVREDYLGEQGQRLVVKSNGKKSDTYINDAKVVDADIKAGNGVIHAIDGVLKPPIEALGSVDDLKDFNEIIKKAGETDLLNRPHPFTVFAPKGEILGEFSDIEKCYLLSHEGQQDLASIIERHIHDGAIYFMELIDRNESLSSLQGERIGVEAKDKDTLYVDGNKVTEKDFLAANGVIHEIDQVIVPKALKFNLRKTLIGMNATKFVKLLEEAGLDKYLEDDSKSYTILAPLNEALDLDEVPRKYLNAWLSYHIVEGQWNPENLTDGQLLKTESKSDKLNGKKQRVKVQVEDSAVIKGHKSINFGRSGVAQDPITSGKHVIYLLSRSLQLPQDMIYSLPIDLDLSTLVATIYATDSQDLINEAQGITLFAPSNAAFERLGLVTKYLLLPEEESQKKLQTLISFHATKSVFYTGRMRTGAISSQTLAGADITVNKTDDGDVFVRGIGAKDGADRGVVAKVFQADNLVANGVMHKIDRVEIPHNIEISAKNILRGIESSTFIAIMQHANLSDIIESDKKYTLLVPNDRAFARINISALLRDQERLDRVARLHVLTEPIQNGNPDTLFGDDADYPTLLSGDDRIRIKEESDNNYAVEVKGAWGGDGSSARVLGYGRTTDGGGVIQVDTVLVPKNDESFTPSQGLRWWQILLIVIGSIIGLMLLVVLIFYGWKWWQNRREGYIALGDNH
ncbi:hypothetical protein INT43_002024 [Umbelopsis isabellina]|uniref:FAS1 domain-containing protein n=1 Tax=Mortierella isabellina TaxID=91625 RepID=A0A8H7PRK3_MORIS|nr:hypothetical protein INT43_002024 [Umbelopsis isabellina]